MSRPCRSRLWDCGPPAHHGVMTTTLDLPAPNAPSGYLLPDLADLVVEFGASYPLLGYLVSPDEDVRRADGARPGHLRRAAASLSSASASSSHAAWASRMRRASRWLMSSTRSRWGSSRASASAAVERGVGLGERLAQRRQRAQGRAGRAEAAGRSCLRVAVFVYVARVSGSCPVACSGPTRRGGMRQSRPPSPASPARASGSEHRANRVGDRTRRRAPRRAVLPRGRRTTPKQDGPAASARPPRPCARWQRCASRSPSPTPRSTAGRPSRRELPHRERVLLINHRLARRILDAHAAWLDEAEAELRDAAARRR